MTNLSDPRWFVFAACRNMDTDLFFPRRGDPDSYPDEARDACAACPCRRACRDYAVATNQKHGMWGGTTPKQRRLLRKQAA